MPNPSPNVGGIVGGVVGAAAAVIVVIIVVVVRAIMKGNVFIYHALSFDRSPPPSPGKNRSENSFENPNELK